MNAEAAENIDVALALGSNMGDRRAVLLAALAALAPYVAVKVVSPVYETAAVYVTDQPAFLNAALIGTTRLSPVALLRSLKQVEMELGRQPTFRYGPRRLDIDILFYDDQTMIVPELQIPHPRMSEREFVLRPLANIAPLWRHPINGLTVAEMLERVASVDPICLGPLAL